MKALRSHRAGGPSPEVCIAVRACGINAPVRGEVVGMIE
jgi:hypothetical protein